jgi:hypothetical protein
MALQVTVPRSMIANNHARSEGKEEDYPQHSPVLTDWCIAVAAHLSESQYPVELLVDKEDLVARLIAAVNIKSDARIGDGLDKKNHWIPYVS